MLTESRRSPNNIAAGVFRARKRFAVRVSVNGRWVYLGLFRLEAEAVRVSNLARLLDAGQLLQLAELESAAQRRTLLLSLAPERRAC